MDELKKALDFYNKVDVSLIAAESVVSVVDDSSGSSRQQQRLRQVNIRWEISVIWPTAWDARVHLSGTSLVTLDSTLDNRIVRQMDRLDNGGRDGNDLVRAFKSQFLPRFWDVYHIGMTPGAEILQRLAPTNTGQEGLRRLVTSVTSPYQLFELAPRLVLRPSLVDVLGRDGRQAQMIPNHAFTTIIRTMGKKKQKYIPVSPVEVTIQKLGSSKEDGSRITWTLSVPPELSKRSVLPLTVQKVNNDDAVVVDEDWESAECRYVWQPQRKVATLSFGGSPQDTEVSLVRKQLYEAVLRDGLRPKLEDDGKPSFFFLQNDAKACFTKNGLGMAVYDWRPEFVKCNEVGIELEL